MYSIMGDPSLSPYMGVPAANAVSAPTSILVGQTGINVTAAAGSYVCLSMNGVIYGVGTVDGSGTLSLTITPFATTGTADLVVTCQNRVTNIRTINVIPASGAYINVDSFTYSDTNNNQPDYNENGFWNVTFKNVGSLAATNINTTLSTSASGITISDNSETISTLAAGASSTINHAYAFSVANNIADQTSIPFHIAMVSGANTWTYDFNTIIQAPAINFGSITISDPSPGGNNNGRLDAGETATISIPIQNMGHAVSPSGNVNLLCPTTGITVINGSYSCSAIPVAGNESATFTISVGAGVATGTAVTLNFSASLGAYSASKTESAAVGIVTETFETGNLNSQAWYTSGSSPYWSVVNSDSHAGTYCAKSGVITNSQSTDLKVTMVITAAGNISFYCKTSSESGYDFLKFYIDSTETGSWSGETAWGLVTYPVSTGSHIFKWTYLKDISDSEGSDAAWIDDIVFPPPQGLWQILIRLKP
jgi:hypothetical protein